MRDVFFVAIFIGTMAGLMVMAPITTYIIRVGIGMFVSWIFDLFTTTPVA